jgi:hypothetical protein
LSLFGVEITTQAKWHSLPCARKIVFIVHWTFAPHSDSLSFHYINPRHHRPLPSSHSPLPCPLSTASLRGLHTPMLRRLTAIPRPAAALVRQAVQARSFSKPAVAASNVVLELDANKVGNEIRKRGLTSAVANRDGGMDRVSIIKSDVERAKLLAALVTKMRHRLRALRELGLATDMHRTLSSVSSTRSAPARRLSVTSASSLSLPRLLLPVVSSPRPSLPSSSAYLVVARSCSQY